MERWPCVEITERLPRSRSSSTSVIFDREISEIESQPRESTEAPRRQ